MAIQIIRPCAIKVMILHLAKCSNTGSKVPNAMYLRAERVAYKTSVLVVEVNSVCPASKAATK